MVCQNGMLLLYSTTMKLATMDIGSGTVRVLLAEVEGRHFHRVSIKRRITRLADCFAERRIDQESMRRTVDAVQEFAREARSFGAVEIRAACTGVTRRAANAGDFLAALREQAGLEPMVITGELEADISAHGAALELGFGEQPFMLMDIGGFSTEVAQVREGRIVQAVSLELGSVILAGRHLRNDPPTTAQLAACETQVRTTIRKKLKGLKESATNLGPLVGTAGTITNLLAMDLKMERYDPERINRGVLAATGIQKLFELMVSMPAEERLSIPGLEKGREDLLPAGAIICREIMHFFGVERLLVTEGGVLEGLAVFPEWPPPPDRVLTL